MHSILSVPPGLSVSLCLNSSILGTQKVTESEDLVIKFCVVLVAGSADEVKRSSEGKVHQ